MEDLLKEKILVLKEDAEKQLSKLDFKTGSLDDFVEAMKIFSDDLAYISLGGNCSYGGGIPGVSDIDVVVAFRDSAFQHKGDVKTQISEFIPNYKRFNLVNGFTPDYVFPGEYMTLSQIEDAISGRSFKIIPETKSFKIPLLSDSDYLKDYERWFQVWLTINAFSTYVFGDIDLFLRNKLLCWKSFILYLICETGLGQLTVNSILEKVMSPSLDEFRIDDTYKLFKEKEEAYVAAVLDLLESDEYLKKKGNVYQVNRSKADSWKIGILDSAKNGLLSKSPFLFEFYEIIGFGNYKI